MIHRGSVGALRFNAAPILEGVQAIDPTVAPTAIEPASMPHANEAAVVPVVRMFNPVTLSKYDGKARKAPRALRFDPNPLILSEPVVLVGEGMTAQSVVPLPLPAPSGSLVYALPSSWFALYAIAPLGSSAEALLLSLRFLY